MHGAISDLKSSFEGLKAEVQSHGRSLTRVTQRIDRNPINMLQRAAARNQALPVQRQLANVSSNATLHPSPRTVQLLWTEYIEGIGGRKAAKDFTPQERGRDKSRYCRRKVVWDLIKTQVNAGRMATDVINSIYAHCGGLSVTAIIQRVRKDKKDGTLPAHLRF